MKQGPLIILSGPSGSGKSTVVERLLTTPGLPLRLSVSVTTRPPRGEENNDVQYHFWTAERFLREVEQHAFLEWAEVHGCYYGTLRNEVDPYRARGIGVILVIDVQGAAQVRRLHPECVSIFLKTASPEVLEQRLRGRGTESEEAIQRRLRNARRELERANEYTYQITNDNLEETVMRLRSLLAPLFAGGTHAG